MLDKFLKILFIWFIPFTISSCLKDAQLEKEENYTDVDVYFRLSVDGSANPLTDGTWNDNLDIDPNNDYSEENGTPFDNKIKTETVKVLVFQKLTNSEESDKYIGEVEDLMCYPIGNAGNEYQFVGTLPKVLLQEASTYKFMVLANTGQSVSGISDLNELDFAINDVQYKESNFIPMWGVISLNLVASQSRYDLGTIYLLRAAAKVEITLSDEMAKRFQLVNAQIQHLNEEGYVLPKSWNSVSKTTDLCHESQGTAASFNPKDPKTVSSNSHDFTSINKGKKMIAYLPEYKNSTSQETVASVTVKEVSSNLEYTFKDNIKFRYYSKGSADMTKEPYNIVRNYCYQFNIGKIVVGSELDLTCKVNPWEVKEEEWDYTQQVSVSQTIQWKDKSYQSLDIQNGKVVINPGKMLECNFQIDTPVGASWYASFIPLGGSQAPFRFFQSADDMGEGTLTIEGKVGSKSTLYIAPSEDTIEENNLALLKIVVRTPDNRTILVQSLMPKESKVKEGFIIIQSK